jgi:hypothetical protein
VIKLLFAAAERLPDLLESVRHQREVYLRVLQRVGAEGAKLKHLAGDSFLTALHIDGVGLTVRAELGPCNV